MLYSYSIFVNQMKCNLIGFGDKKIISNVLGRHGKWVYYQKNTVLKKIKEILELTN